MNIKKEPQPQAVSDEQLEKINRLTRRALAKEEVFTFSVVLCDNEIDRDLECFDSDALEKLAELFLGKTGVFDHAARAENQSARIFDAAVAETGESNSMGIPYRCLKAWAYMVRCEKNTDLILEIDAGIKKEVSVGCAVERITCSVCGQDQKTGSCEHRKGERYAGRLCYHLLQSPTDAYEWSFVAVPAQKNAGVVKTHRVRDAGAAAGEGLTLQKLFAGSAGGELVLTAAERKSLAREYYGLQALARAGEQYLDGLRRDVVKLTLLTRPELEPGVMEEVAKAMDVEQLQAFQAAFAAGLEERFPVPQLGGSTHKRETDAMNAFKL